MASKRKTDQAAAPRPTAKSTKATQRRPAAQAQLPPAAEVTPTTETAVAGMPATEFANAETPATAAAIAETPAAEVPPAPEQSCPKCQAPTPQLRPSGYCSEWCESEAAGLEPPRHPHNSEAAKATTSVTAMPPTEASSPWAGPVTVPAAVPKKLSALDAAARVLAETSRPMNCQALIAAMAEKGYWTSPAGRTPAATLYAALLKEVRTKGAQSRFRKVDRGRFARHP